MMQCQYANCANIGVYSCSECGLLICGKHAHPGEKLVQCQNCWSTMQQALTKEATEADRTQNRGCAIIAVSAGLAVPGLILAIAAGGVGWGALGELLVIVGVIGFVVGFFHFMF